MTQSQISLGCVRRKYEVVFFKLGLAVKSMLLASFLFRACLMMQPSFELQQNFTSEYNRFIWNS